MRIKFNYQKMQKAISVNEKMLEGNNIDDYIEEIISFIYSFIEPNPERPLLYLYTYLAPLCYIIENMFNKTLIKSLEFTSVMKGILITYEALDEIRTLIKIKLYEVIKRCIILNFDMKQILKELKEKYVPYTFLEDNIYETENLISYRIDTILQNSNLQNVLMTPDDIAKIVNQIAKRNGNNNRYFNVIIGNSLELSKVKIPINKIISISTAAIMNAYKSHITVNLELETINTTNLTNNSSIIDINNMEKVLDDYIENALNSIRRIGGNTEIEYTSYTDKDEQIINNYIECDMTPLLSCYGEIIDMLDSTDERQIRKCIDNGILNNEIGFYDKNDTNNNDEIIVTDAHVMDVRIPYPLDDYGIADVLLYFVAKHMNVSEIYVMDYRAYLKVCMKILHDFPEFKKIFRKQLDHIKTKLHYKNSISTKEIYIRIIVPDFMENFNTDVEVDNEIVRSRYKVCNGIKENFIKYNNILNPKYHARTMKEECENGKEEEIIVAACNVISDNVPKKKRIKKHIKTEDENDINCLCNITYFEKGHLDD